MNATLLTFADRVGMVITGVDILRIEELYCNLENRDDKRDARKVGAILTWAWKLEEKVKRHNTEREQLEHELVCLANLSRKVGVEI